MCCPGGGPRSGWARRGTSASTRRSGVPYPPIAERLERLEEALQIVRQMWSDDDGPYTGRHYHLAETLNAPQPLQDRPPIMVGGSGEKKTLRLVARYADACNIFAGPQIGPGELARKLDVLAAHCDREGTDLRGDRQDGALDRAGHPG